RGEPSRAGRACSTRRPSSSSRGGGRGQRASASPREDLLDGRRHVLERGVVERREERQRERPRAHVLRDGAVAGLEAPALAVVGLEVDGREVDADAYVLLLERLEREVAALARVDEHGEQVERVHVPRRLALLEHAHALHAREALAVARDEPAPRGVHRPDLLELPQAERGLEVEHVVLEAGLEDLVELEVFVRVTLPNIATNPI